MPSSDLTSGWTIWSSPCEDRWYATFERVAARMSRVTGIEEIYRTLDAMTARYIRVLDNREPTRISNLKILAEKEKKINENKSSNR